MQRKHHIWVTISLVTLLLGGLLTSAFVQPARAIGTTEILKVGGVLLAVNQFGDQIDSFINNLLKQRKNAAAGATKVVPIVSVGQGVYIGAAQVIGEANRVQRVQAVATVEGVLNKFEGTLLVPISTKMPGKKLSRVEGVGVSAIVDIKL